MFFMWSRSIMEHLTEEDFDSKVGKTFEWIADNKLRRFRIIRHDGIIKEINFDKLTQALKLQDLMEKKIKGLENQAKLHHNVGKWYLNEWKSILEESKKCLD